MGRSVICVIFGGKSAEYEVSCASAASVLDNLNADKYDIIKLGITKRGEWFIFDGANEAVRSGEWLNGNVRPAIISPDTRHRGLIAQDDIIRLDAALPVMHGAYGEDGCIQGLLELSGIPYWGSGVLASALCMDKLAAKIALAAAGVPQSAWIALDGGALAQAPPRVEQCFTYPVFVKPSNTGSSVGISKARNREELCLALENAAQHSRRILVEEFIDGREVECSVKGNLNPGVSCVGEIVPKREFYDYEAKYGENGADLIIPARLSDELTERVRGAALAAYKALDCRGFARVDFFVRHSDGAVILNEINNIPGFTSISMYPKLWAESGVLYSELLDELISLAIGGCHG